MLSPSEAPPLPQDSAASSVGPLAQRCHGCKGGEGWGCELWEHTLLLTGDSDSHLEMTQLSHCTLRVLCLCHATNYIHRNKHDVCVCFFFFPLLIPEHSLHPLDPNEYNPLRLYLCLAWLIQYQPAIFYFIFCCSTVPRGHLNRSSIPRPAPQTSVDTLSIIPRPLPPPPTTTTTTSMDLSTARQQVAASLWDCPSSSWWFTVLLHKLTLGISQCLNTEALLLCDEKRILSFSLLW